MSDRNSDDDEFSGGPGPPKEVKERAEESTEELTKELLEEKLFDQLVEAVNACLSGDCPERSESLIDEWVQGTRDDLDEIIRPMISQPTEATTRTEQPIENWTVAKICEGLKNGKFKNIVVFTGAGISTSAGIPDFRTPGTGLYDNLQAYDLESPEDIFSLDFFRENPKPFYTLAKEIMPYNDPPKYYPTKTHHFIKMLEEKGLLSYYFTQNIDGLDKLAGISDEKIIQVHGSFDSNHCAGESCNESVSHELVIEAMQEGEPLQCPHCTIKGNNNSFIKPDITFFGEALPDKFFETADPDALENCDLLIIIGTSLGVSPANFIPHFIPKHCPRLLINREPVGGDDYEWVEDEDRIYASRDAFIESDADHGCLILAEALGIKEELNSRFDEMTQSDSD